MEMLLAAGALVVAGYLIAREVKTEVAPEVVRKRVADYYVAGTTDVSDAMASGKRLLELNIGSDMQDRPVILPSGEKFEPVCVALLNQAFSNKDPFILSLVFHTDTTVTLNAVAKSLRETVHRQLVPPTPNLAEVPLDTLAGKLILVSGPEMRGSDLEPLVTLSWGDSGLRRLDYARALHPRDPEELKQFATHHLVLVVSDKSKGVYAGDNEIVASGCQWNLAGMGTGFIERTGV
jgi:hypothetical protein